jgi:metal-responsive CopG/Arc/MetJ family transcriptional regulator
MANSPLVSLRIPEETLEKLDNLAEKLYPSRKINGKPNRSQVILDAIAHFLEEQESNNHYSDKIEEKMNQILVEYQKHLEKEIKGYIDEKFVAYAYNLEQKLKYGGKVIR